MKRLNLAVALVLLLLSRAAAENARHEQQIIVQATVMRIEPWGPVKIACGVVLVTRLAEYRVDATYKGKVNTSTIIVNHLACNYNELDDLKPGDRVIVVATIRKKPEHKQWRHYPLDDPKNSEQVEVLYWAQSVAKVVFPTVQSR